MKRFLGAFMLMAMALFVFGALAVAAPAPTHKAHGAAGGAQTISGEIVDMSCYFGKGGKGAGHKECAAQCIANGGPMGLLTSKGALYVLTMNHDNMDAFNSAKKFAGDKVKVTGAVSTKNGTRALEVNGVAAM